MLYHAGAYIWVALDGPSTESRDMSVVIGSYHSRILSLQVSRFVTVPAFRGSEVGLVLLDELESIQ